LLLRNGVRGDRPRSGPIRVHGQAITERPFLGPAREGEPRRGSQAATPIRSMRDRERGRRECSDGSPDLRDEESGTTLTQIADALDQVGVPTRCGGKWWPGTVRYIPDNPKYRGQVEHLFGGQGRRRTS
jgi:site-specific DNA recombinase